MKAKYKNLKTGDIVGTIPGDQKKKKSSKGISMTQEKSEYASAVTGNEKCSVDRDTVMTSSRIEEGVLFKDLTTSNSGNTRPCNQTNPAAHHTSISNQPNANPAQTYAFTHIEQIPNQNFVSQSISYGVAPTYVGIQSNLINPDMQRRPPLIQHPSNTSSEQYSKIMTYFQM